jgi:tRNA threonylcarbamoyl adenosine modification protein YeaZ
MITLGIDTSTAQGAAAILRDSHPVAEEKFGRGELFSALQKLPDSRDVGLIVVGIGPGSFTGIRASIAAAKGLALPSKLPVVGVSSFDALALTALPALPRDGSQMCVICDARRDEVYWVMYDERARRVGEIRLDALEEIAHEMRNPLWFVSAEIEKFVPQLQEIFGGFAAFNKTPVFPSAAALAWLGARRFAEQKRDGEVLEPIYLRQLDYKKS